MRRLTEYVVLALALSALMVACKPTERNYRLAYDKAQDKARQGLTDMEYDMMLANSLPPYARTRTDSVRTFSEAVIWQYTPLAVDSGRKQTLAPYNLAVGKYSMLTNAKAHADRLAGDGWRSVVVRNGEPVYYVVVKMSADLDTVARAAHVYSARYPRGTVALHEPMAIIPAVGR